MYAIRCMMTVSYRHYFSIDRKAVGPIYMTLIFVCISTSSQSEVVDYNIYKRLCEQIKKIFQQ